MKQLLVMLAVAAFQLGVCIFIGMCIRRGRGDKFAEPDFCECDKCRKERGN